MSQPSNIEREPRFYPWPGGLYMMGRFSVPWWFFNVSPNWLHRAADWCGGVEPSPWRKLRQAKS